VNARLHCQHGSQLQASFEVSGAQTDLGREATIDVSIPLAGVSRRHARITWDGKAFWIEDLRSLNGTFLNGRKVHREKLRHLDVVTLGKTVDLVFEVVSARAADGPHVARVALEPTDGSASRELPAGDTTLGRAEGSTIVIEDPAVAPHHARVERRRGHLLVRDLGSSSGTYVNGKPVNAAWLKNGDEVSLGGVVTYRVVLESDAGAPPPIPRTAPAPTRRADETRYEWDAAEEESLARLRQRLLKLQAEAAASASAGGSAATAPPTPAMPPSPPAGPAPPQPARPAAPASVPAAVPPVSAPAAARMPPRPAAPPPAAAPSGPATSPGMPARPARTAPPPPTDEPPVAAPPIWKTTFASPPAADASPTAAPSDPAGAPPAPVSNVIAPGEAKTVRMRAPLTSSPPLRPRESRAAARDAAPAGGLRRVRLRAPGVNLVVEEPGTYELGRSPTADLRVEHISVSRQHSRLVLSADRTWATIEDHASANGTYVNGEAVHLPVFLSHGDKVGIGQLELKVILEPAPGEAG
jgi:pSer/pThr/pTyr-binding forkhead associated (FHA) protein